MSASPPDEPTSGPTSGPVGPSPGGEHPGARPGEGVVRASLVGTAVFCVVGVAGALAPDVFGVPFLAVSLLEFLAGTVAFGLAFLRAVDRSRTEAIGVGGLFFAAGSAPAWAQRRLLASLVVQVVVAVVVASVRIYSVMAFGVLAPMWALGLTGLWVSAHGSFPARTPEPTRAARRDADRRAHRAADPAGRRDRTE